MTTQSHHSLDTLILIKAFDTFKEPTLSHRRFKHQDIEPLILKLKRNSNFKVSALGESVQRRSIYQVDFGSGTKKIMLWSQMHGDESTATMALFDIFNFLGGENDQFDSIRTIIREKTQLSFIPMLNPDGAEIFNRRNALGIDINRDARSGTTPEGAILIEAAKRNQPEYGFNLHDQQRYYTAGYSDNAATISFLAPAYNYEREVNSIREDAMKIIVGMNKTLQGFIPDGVAKYDDTHEPRGFGDNFQKWGARTVLIESGGYPGDTEKQYIRKLNFIIILSSILDIAKNNYQHYDPSEYEKIPENRTKLNELLIRNIGNTIDSFTYKTDVAIKRDEINLKNGGYYVRGRIDDAGDLKESFGYQELDAEGLSYQEGKVFETVLDNISTIDFEKALQLLRQGYFAINIKNRPSERHYNLPLIILKNSVPPIGNLTLGSHANFFLKKQDTLKYAVVNGYLIDLENPVKENYDQYIQ
jgi:hypothetical protein